MSTSPISSSSLGNLASSSGGTSSTSGSSANNTSTSGDSSLVQPLTITTVSQYGSDLQSVLNRAVEIADIPVQQLQNQEEDNQTKQAALIGLNTDISTFVNDLNNLGTLASTGSLTPSSSDSNVSVSNTGATAAGSWTISNIQSIASAASALTSANSPYADASSTQVSSSGQLTLEVDGTTYPTISLTSATNNLNGVAAALNAISGDPVSATVITAGSGENYLSVTANNTGEGTVQLFDGSDDTGTNLLADSTAGTNLEFDLDGYSVNQSSNVVNSVVQGLTFTFNGMPSSSNVTLSLTTDPSQLSTALSTFVQDYNTLANDIAQQTTSSSPGPLMGDMALTSLESDMQQLVSYQGNQGSNGVNNLAALGITLNDSGQMSFSQSTFDALSSSQVQSAISFIGSSTSGLASLANTFDQLSDPTDGMIQSEESGIDQTDTDISDQIATKNQQIQSMQQNLSSQLEQADTLISQLQSQQTILTASLTSLNFVLYGAPPSDASS